MAEPLSGREKRDLENNSCLGGMRNPRFSVEKVPDLRKAGRAVHDAIDEFISTQYPGFVEDLLSEKGEAMASKVEAEASSHLARRLGVSARRGQVGKLRPEIARAISALSGDPDGAVLRWMDSGAPLGIDVEIEPCGVFPIIEGRAEEAREEADKFYAKTSVGVIYRSALEEGEWVQEKLSDLVKTHCMTRFTTLAEAKAVFGELILSKLACLVKDIPGTEEKKRRLLVDLLRSGSNACATVPERGVLPRLSDAVGDIKRLAFACGPGEFVDLLAVDVSDAFYAAGVDPREQRWQAVVGPDGAIYVFSVLAMGSAAAPLIWGRIVAWLGRHTAGMFDPDKLRLQIFVDDPLFTARGTRPNRRRALSIAIIFWMSMGLAFSWRKRQLGCSVIWIGVQMDATKDEITLAVQARFVQKLLTEVRELRKLRSIPVKRMRSFVGGLTWMLVIIRWMRAWLSPLWAAIAYSAAWDGPPERASIGMRQVEHSLSWVEAFLSGQRGSIIRTIPVTPAAMQALIQTICDASPFGVGAVLVENGVPTGFLHDTISEDDRERMGTTAGQCQGQSAFETLAVLIAVRTWMPIWVDLPVAVIVQSDSIAALGAAAKSGSGIPHMNAVIREMALDLAEGNYHADLFGHVPGSLNVWADALSRLLDPNKMAAIPDELKHLPRTTVQPRTSSWWRSSGPPS